MKILLVDDDNGVLQALLRMLQTFPGYEVTVASSGAEALEKATTQSPPDLLITDVIMEPMNGLTLCNKIANRFPQTKTIFITGYDLSQYAEYTQGHPILIKPISPKELLRAIESVIEPAPDETQAIAEKQTPAPVEAVDEKPASAVPAEAPIATADLVAPAPAVEEAKPAEQTELPLQAPASTEPEVIPTATLVAGPPSPPAPMAPPAPAPEEPAPLPIVAPQATPVAAAAPAPAPAPTAAPQAVAVPKVTATPAPAPTATPQAVAVPKVTATPAPAPTATPQAVAVPKVTATPAPAPSATPQAVSVPKVTATPAPAPSATPQAVPVPKVTATPAPAPSATPKAVAVPKVTATPAPAPTATPKAVAVPKVTAMPASAPTATPQAVPVPKITYTQAPVPTAKPKAVPAATAAPATPADGLIGSTIGAYKIVRELGKGTWGRVYEAIQTSMNRTVAMELLSPELENDPAAKSQFIANASAKANIQHPQILSVYEAGEAGGHSYFTREYVDGINFAKLVEKGQTIDEPVALKTVKVIAEALSYFSQKKIAHSPLDAASIYLGSDKRPRLANLATHGETHPEVQSEIRTLGQAVSAALPGGRATSPGLAGMFIRMKTGGQNAFQSWASLLQAVAALEPKVIPADAFKLSAQDEAAILAVDAARKKQKRQLILSIIGAVALACVSGMVLWKKFGSNEKNFDAMVKIPAGEFTYQDGKKVNLPTFWIDQYEVTIGQYARFLEYLEAPAHKDEKYKFDHPDQPKGKSHKPLNWDIYLGRAKWAKPVKFIPIDMNCPQFLVDWWDAYAYANWKGRRLPTEQEWEKAARGTDGRLYPWGSEFDQKKCNSNADYIDRPTTDSIGRVDGFFAWSPVDAIPGDKSPYGVMGMAGNVSEWTGSLVNTPDGKVPVIRGGNYRSPDNKVTQQKTSDHEATNEYLGFRTASDAAPK